MLSVFTSQTTLLDAKSGTGNKKDLSKTKAGSKGIVIAAVIVFALVAGLAYYLLLRKTTTAIESIAVLPFVNESGNSDIEYLSDGMTNRAFKFYFAVSDFRNKQSDCLEGK